MLPTQTVMAFIKGINKNFREIEMDRNMARFMRKILSLAVLSVPLSLLILSACGGGATVGSGSGNGGGFSNSGGGAGTGVTGTLGAGAISLSNGQAAKVVVGQASFTSSAAALSATGLSTPYSSVSVSGSQLYISDYGNNRVLVFNGIPTSNGASAVYALGQPNLITNTAGVSATTMSGPQSPVVSGNQLFAAEFNNSRIDIYNAIPTASPGTISVVAGQANNTSSVCGVSSAASLCLPETVSVAGGKMVVADAGHNRVMIWNSIPTVDGTAANLVLGQPNFTSFASGVSATSLNYAGGAWTDGTRVVVLDTNNNRVLIWKTFPASNGQAADVVLGQTSFTSNAPGTSATTLNAPYEGVFVSAAGQLFVVDSRNNRVLVWNAFPTTNGQAADVVLGQPNFTTSTTGTSATTLNNPVGVSVSGTQVFVTDQRNNRVLIY